jgi:hypothetical protein
MSVLQEPAPEDYTSLFRWITFAWVYPLIRRVGLFPVELLWTEQQSPQGTNNTLTEKDVPNLSPTMQARPVFYKFTQLKFVSLDRRCIGSNRPTQANHIAAKCFGSQFLGFAVCHVTLSINYECLIGFQGLMYSFRFSV